MVDVSLGNSVNGFSSRHSPLRSSTPPNKDTRMPLAQSLSQFPSQFAGSSKPYFAKILPSLTFFVDLMNEDSDMQRLIHDLEIDTASEGHADDNAAYTNGGHTGGEFNFIY